MNTTGPPGVGIAQHVCRPGTAAHRARELELLCFAMRSLAEIKTTLAETNDLLRRLLVTKFSNFAHVKQNSARASGSSHCNQMAAANRTRKENKK
jgi:hypothetical protein